MATKFTPVGLTTPLGVGQYPALVNPDSSGNLTVPSEQYILNGAGLYVPAYSPATATLQNAAAAAGPGTALNVRGYGLAVVQLTGTWVGTVSFQATADGTNWWAIQGRSVQDGSIVTSATANGAWRFDVTGLTQIRANITAYTSGNVTANGYAQVQPDTAKSMALTGPGGSSGSPLFVEATGSNAAIGNIIIQSGLSSVQASVKGTDGDGQTINHALEVMSGRFGFNGTSWDRTYNNTQGTLLASAARTSAAFAPNQTNYNARGVVVFLSVTAASGTGGLSIHIVLVDPVSGNSVYTAPNPTAVVATGLYAYMLYPSASGTANTGGASVVQWVSSALTRTWTAWVGAGDTSSYTYSLGYALIL